MYKIQKFLHADDIRIFKAASSKPAVVACIPAYVRHRYEDVLGEGDVSVPHFKLDINSRKDKPHFFGMMS